MDTKSVATFGPGSSFCSVKTLIATLAFVVAVHVFVCLAPPRAYPFMQAQFQAQQVVRLWFDKQDGVQVAALVSGMGRSEVRNLMLQVDQHPFVLEVKRGLHGRWMLQQYYSLCLTLEDALVYN